MCPWTSERFDEGRTTRAVRLLLIVTIAVFVLQFVADHVTGGLFSLLFGLNGAALMRGYVWQPVTYMFLHGGPIHLLFNLMWLFFFGPDIERVFGTRRFIVFYLVCGVFAGLGWVAISGAHGGMCIGASGAIFGVFGAFAALFPDRPVTLIFPIPVTLRARTLVLILGAINFAFLFEQGGTIAHAAHLGGGVIGYLYGRRYARTQDWATGSGVWSRLMDAVWSRLKSIGRRSGETQKRPSPEEVDRILEKISKEGISSLSPRERETLERAAGKR